MNWKRIFLWTEALLCVLLCAALALGALRICARGADGGEWLYTREKAARALRPALPLLIAVSGLAAAGALLGVKGTRPRRIADAPERLTPLPERRKTLIRAFLFAAAVLCILAGILNGGMRDVLYKAINICTECIGLG